MGEVGGGTNEESAGEENRRLPVTRHFSGVHRSSMFLLRQTTSIAVLLTLYHSPLPLFHSFASLSSSLLPYCDNEAAITFTRVLREEFALVSSYRSFAVRSFDPR